MTDLVRGEASESEEDEEKCGMKKSVFASEIGGEVSESDDDIDTKDEDNVVLAQRNTNVLQQLLIKNNTAIWSDLNIFVSKIITEATKPLLSMERILIKSQMIFSSMLSSLKVAQVNVSQLHEKASDTFTANFIPNIKIKSNMP